MAAAGLIVFRVHADPAEERWPRVGWYQRPDGGPREGAVSAVYCLAQGLDVSSAAAGRRLRKCSLPSPPLCTHLVWQHSTRPVLSVRVQDIVEWLRYFGVAAGRAAMVAERVSLALEQHWRELDFTPVVHVGDERLCEEIAVPALGALPWTGYAPGHGQSVREMMRRITAGTVAPVQTGQDHCALEAASAALNVAMRHLSPSSEVGTGADCRGKRGSSSAAIVARLRRPGGAMTIQPLMARSFLPTPRTLIRALEKELLVMSCAQDGGRGLSFLGVRLIRVSAHAGARAHTPPWARAVWGLPRLTTLRAPTARSRVSRDRRQARSSRAKQGHFPAEPTRPVREIQAAGGGRRGLECGAKPVPGIIGAVPGHSGAEHCSERSKCFPMA